MMSLFRSAGVGLCSMCARVAGILAPYILILSDYWEPLPVPHLWYPVYHRRDSHPLSS